MMDRRELLKSSLRSCGATLLASWFPGAVLTADTAMAEPIVRTNAGTLRGRFANGGYSFKGVPYGAPTGGPTRFRPATAPTPWTGVRDALEIGPPAPQDRDFSATPEVRRFVGDIVGPQTTSEDCLVLNVWTTSLQSSSQRPVMVWLHGGGYFFGSGGIPETDGSHLAAKHDVVVVTLNHRLNVFGYLYLAGLGGEAYTDSGNVGMLDIVLALEWVRENIARFGGDPANVTLFGVSGGGAKVTTLMAMPAAKGLFHKAIVESGAQLRVNTREEADAAAREFLAQLQVAPDHLDDLRRLPMERLVATMHAMGNWVGQINPVVDGRSLPRHPFDPDAPAEAAQVPMLIGTNADETRSLLGLSNAELFSLSESDLRAKLRAYLHLTDESTLDAVIVAYRSGRPDPTPSDIYFAVTTDRAMRMEAITQAERKVAQRAAPAYMYLFAWQTPVFGGKLRASHGIEMPFAFDNVDGAARWIGTGADLQALADKVSGAWTRFAHTGNPNATGLPHWPAYDMSARATMIFNDQCMVENDPGKEGRLAMAGLSPTPG